MWLAILAILLGIWSVVEILAWCNWFFEPREEGEMPSVEGVIATAVWLQAVTMYVLFLI